MGSKTLSQQEISDLGNNFIRTQLVAVPGAAVPVPYGGKNRVVNVDLDPDALYARGISPQEVASAILAQNLVLSAGTVKMGAVEYDVAMNSSPALLEDLNKHSPAPGERGDGVRARCGFRPRRILAADQPGAERRAGVGPPADPDQRERLDADGCEGACGS